MTTSAKVTWLAVFLIWVAGGLQQTLSPRIEFLTGQPDFLLVMLSSLGLFCNRRGGSVLGFAIGLIHGGLAGADLSAYTVTRTVVGFLLGWFNELELESNWVLAFLVTAGITVLAQLMLMFGVHRGPLTPFLTGTLISAVYNGVLAIPVYALLKRILGPINR